MSKKKIAFLTIGQTPRSDIVPVIVPRLNGHDYEEFGALDGLEDDALSAMSPLDGEFPLCTLLSDGREIVVGKPRTEKLLQKKVDEIDGKQFDLTVLLCTSHFPNLVSRTTLIPAQRAVDDQVDSLCATDQVGLIVPLEEQARDWRKGGNRDQYAQVAFFSPYTGEWLEDARSVFGRCSVVVMHCMGYDHKMKDRVAAEIDKPVFLARELLMDAILTALDETPG